MNRKQKKDIEEIKDFILQSTRILDRKNEINDKERWFITDTLIKCNEMLDRLKGGFKNERD